MVDSTQDVIRKNLEQRLADLQAEYTAVSKQISQALSSADRLKLERQAAAIQREMEELEQRLNTMGGPPKSDGSAPSNAQELVPPVSKTATKPSSAGTSSHLTTICAKVEWLWFAFVLWVLVSALGIVAGAMQIFGLEEPIAILAFGVLVFVGGAVILVLSLTRSCRSCFRSWDRALTFVLWIFSSVALAVIFLKNPDSPAVSPTETPSVTPTSLLGLMAASVFAVSCHLKGVSFPVTRLSMQKRGHERSTQEVPR